MTDMATLLIILLASIAVNVHQHARLRRLRRETTAFINKAAKLEDAVDRLTTSCKCALEWDNHRRWKEAGDVR